MQIIRVQCKLYLIKIYKSKIGSVANNTQKVLEKFNYFHTKINVKN